MMDSQALVLAVEDDPDDVALVQRAFRKVGILNPLRFLNDGEAALDYLAGRGAYADRTANPLPSLLLLDLKLPRKSGLELLAWIRGEGGLPTLPVVVLTSSRHSRDVERAYELGANSYLVKPVDFQDLVAMVDALRLYWIVFNEPASGAGR